jgi:hypothetical protein
MRGDRIDERLNDGSLVERLVWDEREEIVFVTSAENYEQLLRGNSDVFPIGLRRSDARSIETQQH